ncbi:MAG: hypothetical protein HRT87_01675 [Legionellales bacterium]|nr:hypothetical protein [Legionellales bacterium]
MTNIVIRSKFRSRTLQSLWQVKEYRNFNREVTNYIIADTSVYAKNLCIQISISDLADKDKSNIERHLKNTENIRKKDTWLPCKAYVNLPPVLSELLKKASNRKRASIGLEYNPDKKYSSAKKFHVEHRYVMVLSPYSYFLNIAGIRGYHD